MNKNDQVAKDNVSYQKLFGGQIMLVLFTMDDGHQVEVAPGVADVLVVGQVGRPVIDERVEARWAPCADTGASTSATALPSATTSKPSTASRIVSARTGWSDITTPAPALGPVRPTPSAQCHALARNVGRCR